ncbi:hypothetical protein [Amycolatopsis benzoatilytica]|nr:hypothetical protein [Amycolatopsis benzoatilytica]
MLPRCVAGLLAAEVAESMNKNVNSVRPPPHGAVRALAAPMAGTGKD